jgi:hypothetical protein
LPDQDLHGYRQEQVGADGHIYLAQRRQVLHLALDLQLGQLTRGNVLQDGNPAANLPLRAVEWRRAQGNPQFRLAGGGLIKPFVLAFPAGQ